MPPAVVSLVTVEGNTELDPSPPAVNIAGNGSRTGEAGRGGSGNRSAIR